MRSQYSKMDFIERITLSPFEKYSRFGLFPWKFVFHLLLLVMCTYQALKIVSIQNRHIRIQEQVFSTIYLQNQQGTSSFPYYSLIDFTDTFFDIFSQTKKLNQSLLQYSDISNVDYRLEVYYSQIASNEDIQIVFEGEEEKLMQELATIPIQPGNYSQMKTFVQGVENINLRIHNLITYISMNTKGQMTSCFNWTVNLAYSFQSFANVQSKLNVESFTCLIGDEESKGESILAINLAIMILSACSLIAAGKQVYYVSKEYMIYKQQITKSQDSNESRVLQANVDWRKNWEDLGFLQKMKFFDFWFIITVAGNFFQFFGAFSALLDEIILENLLIFQQKLVLIGFGVMLAWITILKYLQYHSSLNLMSATLSKSWRNLSMFLLGVMPFFLGFVFLGQTIFWKYNKFEDTSSSAITLFSLLNGDIVNDTFLETWAEGIIGQLYLIIFMILFYTAVQNVFVTIIMEGYEESLKETEYKNLLREKDQEEKNRLEENMLKLKTETQQLMAMSPPERQEGLAKLKLNGKKIDKILEEMEKLSQSIRCSDLNKSEKIYLNGLVRDSLQTSYQLVKLQLKQVDKEKTK